MAALGKILIVAGARPNFMKIAPILKALETHNKQGAGETVFLSHKLVHTGQHYDAKMSDVFFSELGIPAPDINLEAGSGSHAVQTANVMLKFETVCLREKPDWLVVVGDVNSTMACTLVASKLGIKVAHVEAGLRSFDRTMPEEINRLVTDALADLLLTPSPDADENLRREGVAEAKILRVGNVMIDTVMANLETARRNPILADLEIEKKPFVYVTLHRPSNVDERGSLEEIMGHLQRLAGRMTVVFPMHPRTRKMLGEFHIHTNGNAQLKIIEPVGYHESLRLTENARLVLTDSGGLQEETTFFRTPCLTLRPNTERPITVTMGSNKLTNLAVLEEDLENVLQGRERLGQVPDLWDGKAAARIIDALAGQCA
jgi:UDP-N-acetylglucosamine 2-epimerase (non-hydrolysing)